MLSILIPVYNYNISDLVKNIHQQAIEANIIFEIICFDDHSTKHVSTNRNCIESTKHAKLITSEKNLGRVGARQRLSESASYPWLLFLDADVLPKSNIFVNDYIDAISSGHDVYFGGFAYTKSIPEKQVILRWKYGKKFEEVDAVIRNRKPYQIIISANFLINKTTFSKIHSQITKKSYGLDNIFASLLKQNNVRVLHLNNPVYHLGLEKNEIFLSKAEAASNTLLWGFKNGKITKHDNKLLSIFEAFKKLKINYIMMFLHKIFGHTIKKQLSGPNPNIYLLQVYKVLYICHRDLNYKYE